MINWRTCYDMKYYQREDRRWVAIANTFKGKKMSQLGTAKFYY